MACNRPEIIELLEALREYLKSPDKENRQYMDRVAANILSIISREINLGQEQDSDERRRLSALLGTEGSTMELNALLCEKIRNSELRFDNNDLHDHLTRTSVDKLAIDNPRYSRFLSYKDHYRDPPDRNRPGDK